MTKRTVISRNITLYPEQWHIVKKIAQSPAYNGNISLALRFIINDWGRHQKKDKDKEKE